jgi:hypothetical protein
MPEAQSSTIPLGSLGPRYQLSYIFLAVWLVGYTRSALGLVANAARAGARLDRPDQHVYKIMACSGPMKDGTWKSWDGHGTWAVKMLSQLMGIRIGTKSGISLQQWIWV